MCAKGFRAVAFGAVCCMMNQGGSPQKVHLGLECITP
ncbi:hypothetical protein YSA_09773 [Pseudomonas putida ND6]|uniref:Uncharacterized protein n=1 Tax=Pseudomonas putida ND6 TaxID=231023 RepID=I3V2V5_PSEPU|nr:hypothetical protein YSA_09773 [Pseudomonas putida ND6]